MSETNVRVLIQLIYSLRVPSNDQMGFYDYSFNNNYLLFQNNPANYNNSFDNTSATSSSYHDYNSLPSYNHFTPTTSPIFNSSYRQPNLQENGKFPAQVKAESAQVTNSDPISIDKLQSIIHNTSEHVQELNQMCQIKEPKDYEKNLSSKLGELNMGCLHTKQNSNRRSKSHRHLVIVLREARQTQIEKETANPFLAVASR